MELLALLIAWALTRLLLPWQRRFLVSRGWVKTNFRGLPLPVGTGLVPVLLGALWALWAGLTTPHWGLLVATATAGFALLGAVDDRLGDRSHGGLGGHLGALGRGRLTTGALKALGGGVIAVAVSWWWGGGLVVVVVHALLIALSANAVNLLDLRPGRALKVALPLLVAATVVSGTPWAGLTGGAIAVLPEDLAGKGMLGDLGANALGAAVGVALGTLAPLAEALALVLLVALHVYTERQSLSQLIARHPLLRAIDDWGQGGMP